MVQPTTTSADDRGQCVDTLDMNAIVSYNIRAIRERRGLTQQEVADGLARLTGRLLPQASISAMERAFDGPRRRRFDAHELYLLAVVFDVPITYFFLPPAGSQPPQLADTQRPLADLCIALLGREHQLGTLQDRLAEISPHDSHHAVVSPLGPIARWHAWRATRIDVIASGLADRLHAVARVLTDFAATIATGGLGAYLDSPLHPSAASRLPDGREGNSRS